jgi:adenylate cyclase
MRNHRITVENRVILFVDIHDSWTVMNLLGRDACGFLQEIYEKLGDIIVEHKGEILKYMGDGILCLFPDRSENEVVKCASELRKAFAKILSERGISHDTELEVGIGSGEVEIGIFGHKSLLQRDAFGDEVNRVIVIGHHRGIAITRRAYDRIRIDYEVRELPQMEAWEVIV